MREMNIESEHKQMNIEANNLVVYFFLKILICLYVYGKSIIYLRF